MSSLESADLFLAYMSQVPRLIPRLECFHTKLTLPGRIADASKWDANPTPGRPNPMMPTVTLKGRICQVRHATPGETVGYNATFRNR